MASRAGSGRNRVRIIGGVHRGRYLGFPDHQGLRPTADRVRETLFNWLAPHIHGARCLDLYAGTGALGLEALSRGAGSVLFIERSPVATRQLRRNIELLETADATVQQGDALDYLRNASPTLYDIVFIDPPFADELQEETCRLMDERDLLADGAFVYLELPKGRDVELPAGWLVQKDKQAGNVRYMLARIDRSG